jgi:hypothetical protein
MRLAVLQLSRRSFGPKAIAGQWQREKDFSEIFSCKAGFRI